MAVLSKPGVMIEPEDTLIGTHEPVGILRVATDCALTVLEPKRPRESSRANSPIVAICTQNNSRCSSSTTGQSRPFIARSSCGTSRDITRDTFLFAKVARAP